MTVNQYQQVLRELLEARFASPTTCEWRAQMGNGLYSPRLDIAVGPYSIENDVQLIGKYDELYQNNSHFITKLIKQHLSNLSIINNQMTSENIENIVNNKFAEIQHFNYNARCFVSVEIENLVSRKHLMGGAINTSVLGRIGITVGYTNKMHNAFINLYRYFEFLQNVDKPTFRTNNLLVISSTQLLEICNNE